MPGSPGVIHYNLEQTAKIDEDVVILWVRDKYVDSDTVRVAGTTLEDFMADKDVPKSDLLSRGYGSYVLTKGMGREGDSLRYAFAKPKTEVERQTPVSSETIYDLYPWPDWMRCLYAIEDATVPYEIQTAGGSTYKDRVFDRVEFIDGGNYQTEILIEEFLSPEPFPASELFCETPQPTSISYSYLGAAASYSCLHPLVKIPEIQTGGKLVEGFGTANARLRQVTGDIFPATNHTGWQTHVFYNKPQFVDGIYYRMQKTATPVFIPKPTYK